VVCEVLLVQRLRFIGVTVLSILVLTIIGAVSLLPAYAGCTFTTTVTSFTITQGTSSITVSGTDDCNLGTSTVVAQLNSGSCAGPRTFIRAVSTTPGVAGAFTTPPLTTSDLNPGSYCVVVVSQGPGTSPTNISDPLTVTSAAPIPEYPLGLAVLAVFMVLAYTVIRRRTRT
jgi:hypothetical protein